MTALRHPPLNPRRLAVHIFDATLSPSALRGVEIAQPSPWREWIIGFLVGTVAGPAAGLLLYGWVMWVTRP